MPGLVKMYAMVNVQKYQIVATGDTVSACEEQYTTLMYENGIKEVEEDTREILTAEGKITKIAQGCGGRQLALLYHARRIGRNL